MHDKLDMHGEQESNLCCRIKENLITTNDIRLLKKFKRNKSCMHTDTNKQK